MKTENMNNNTTTRGNRTYIKPHAYIIKLETNYRVMGGRSMPTAPNTPATGDGNSNAKQFDMSDDMWGDNHESDIDIFK